MLSAVAGFDWDDGNRAKCQRHGVTLIEIEKLFSKPITVLPDSEHSRTEERFKAIGTGSRGRYVFLTFTLRHRGDAVLIRPIGARYMHRKEIEYYEKEAAKAQNR
jgi:uncharacterized DUF497 family protein